MSDEKHEETHRLTFCLIEKNPTVFELAATIFYKIYNSPITNSCSTMC